MKFTFILFIIPYVTPFFTNKQFFHNKYLCNKENREPEKITIKSVTDLFNAYLKEETNNFESNISIENIKDEINKMSIMNEITSNQNITKKTTSNKTTIDSLYNIAVNIKQYELLKNLENNKTSENVKLNYIEHYKWLFNNDYINLNNGGLMKDWNTIL